LIISRFIQTLSSPSPFRGKDGMGLIPKTLRQQTLKQPLDLPLAFCHPRLKPLFDLRKDEKGRSPAVHAVAVF
jgi:hypothetical protein